MNELIERNNKGQFIKGNNSGHRFKKGESSPRKGIKNPGWTNETSFKRKGVNYSYQGLHTWVRKNLGSATDKECVYCGSNKKLEWANISHEYKEVLNDWMILCSKCHHKYDNWSEKMWKTRKERYGNSGRKISI